MTNPLHYVPYGSAVAGFFLLFNFCVISTIRQKLGGTIKCKYLFGYQKYTSMFGFKNLLKFSFTCVGNVLSGFTNGAKFHLEQTII